MSTDNGLTELEKRRFIIEHCLEMNLKQLNQGTSGNISIRHGDGLLITPTSIAYEKMKPEDIVYLDMDGTAAGQHAPSSEWRIHRDIMKARPDVNGIVHAHATYCTILSIMNLEIPPIHYMVAFAGGSNVRVAPYAIFGSEELSSNALKALEDRNACLLEHHGMIAVGKSLPRAMWLAVEIETLARQYHGCLAIGTPRFLAEKQIEEVAQKIAGYGHQD
ncbi:MAG: class II aldolase [Cereibacter sphaeroides]|uniref:Class II aldolase n=1 Tax=Cereibacter sphaeroides TaxID=1063 RepID=A0A2W5SDU4_CERSP|nr:MAG: class II aldolase [Cereibacter sphaeroides]